MEGTLAPTAPLYFVLSPNSPPHDGLWREIQQQIKECTLFLALLIVQQGSKNQNDCFGSVGLNEMYIH